MSAPVHSGSRTARVARVLVVDDEADLRELLELTVVGMGLDVDCAADLAQARALLARHTYALCLTDMRLPDGEGLELVCTIAAQYPGTLVAVITAHGSAENAVAALKAGAFDYVAKPLALDVLRNLVRSAVQLPAQASASPLAMGEADPLRQLIGDSDAMREMRESIVRLARSMAPVAINGESGSGKELAARLVHQSGPRARQPFVAVNCGAIPETLMESEFFGHRKGAFTGADHERDGFFQAASGGTLFLDEVADLPLSMQVKLLRAIQERRVRKVGATQEEPVDVRIISATHQDLAECVNGGRFRQDLYYRLQVIELKVPSLRERPDDIPVLANALLDRLARRAGLGHSPRLASVTLKYLQSYSFPGNVRELENVLERALAFSDGDVINVEDLGLRPSVSDGREIERAQSRVARGTLTPADAGVVGEAGVDSEGADAGEPDVAARERSAVDAGLLEKATVDRDEPHAGPRDAPDAPGASSPQPALVASARLDEDGVPASLPDYLDQVERQAIERALQKTRYNRTAAARLLGVTFRALRYRMQRLGIQ